MYNIHVSQRNSFLRNSNGRWTECWCTFASCAHVCHNLMLTAAIFKKKSMSTKCHSPVQSCWLPYIKHCRLTTMHSILVLNSFCVYGMMCKYCIIIPLKKNAQTLWLSFRSWLLLCMTFGKLQKCCCVLYFKVSLKVWNEVGSWEEIICWRVTDRHKYG